MVFEYNVNPIRFMSLFKAVFIGYQASLKSCQWRLDPALQWNIVCDGIRKTPIAARYPYRLTGSTPYLGTHLGTLPST